MGGGQRVYIGNIPSDTRERDLEKFCKGYGRINDVVVKNGYGFIEFDSYRDADDAVQDLDGKDLHGGRVRVELARPPGRERDRDRGGRGFGGRSPPRRGSRPGPKTDYRIVVENLSSRTSWQDLKDYFRSAGEISYANAHSPRSGEGLVEFASRKAMEYALDHKDDLELDGRRLKIYEEGRGRGRSRSRSRSRDRRRSRSRSKSRDRSRSKSRDRSRSKSRDRSRSRTPEKSNGRRHSRSNSKSRSRSRSRS